MGGIVWYVFMCTWIWPNLVEGNNLNGELSLGFPEGWLGDSYKNVSCRINNTPSWLDGYFVALVNGAYGNTDDPDGSKLTHMADGLAALASIQLKDGMVRFSGEYLPSKPFKIWDFYGRDMRRSQVAWQTSRSAYSSTAKEKWDRMDVDYVTFNPNENIWKMGDNGPIAGMDTPDLGLQFELGSLGEFHPVHLVDINEIMTGRGSIELFSTALQDSRESDGSVYGTVGGIDFGTNRMYQFVFKINPRGVRTLEGAFEFGRYESSKCGSDLRYMGDKKVLAGVVKSIGTTENYVVIPVTSALVNPCKYQMAKDTNKFPYLMSNVTIHYHQTAIEFGNDVPVRFLVFDKRIRQFVTYHPFDSYPPRFITRLINVYESGDNRIVVDLISYDSYDAYDRAFEIGNILGDKTKRDWLTRPVRFILDIERGYVERRNIAPQDAFPEFPAINPGYSGKRYQFAYMVQSPFTIGNQLAKVDMNDHSGLKNIYFSHGPSVVLGQPAFVPLPNAHTEDDGVLLSLALDTVSRRSVLYVIDAKTMREIGQAEMPIVVPFGLRCRYFDRNELTQTGQTTPDPVFGKVHTSWTTLPPYFPTNVNIINEEFNDQKTQPILITQRSNVESLSNWTSSPFPPLFTSFIKKPTPTAISWLLDRTMSATKTTSVFPANFTNLHSVPTSSPIFTLSPKLKEFTSSNTSPTAQRLYLSNGSFVEIYSDGTTKLHGSTPNMEIGVDLENTRTTPMTRAPAYPSMGPSQIPAPPSLTSPSHSTTVIPPTVNVAPAPSIHKPNSTWTKSPTSTSPVPINTAFPHFIFPGYYATRPTKSSASSPPRSASTKFANSTFAVVDVIVDPNKRTRPPSLPKMIGDDPNWVGTRARSTRSPVNENGQDEVEVERFLQRSRGVLCKLLGKAIAALGSNFCKRDSRGRKKYGR